MSIVSQHEMEESRLRELLQEDTRRDVPPFASESIKLARQMAEAAVNPLLEQINGQGKTRLLALEALRKAVPDVYHSLPARKRAEIYAEALRTASFLNTWGVPGYQLTDTAKALIDIGEEAVAVLRPLLECQQKAPLSGSQAATTSAIYGNRLCDYAWVLISEIKRRPYVYSKDPAARDQAIQALRQELQEETGNE
jgi:hypothetical protein